MLKADFSLRVILIGGYGQPGVPNKQSIWPVSQSVHIQELQLGKPQGVGPASMDRLFDWHHDAVQKLFATDRPEDINPVFIGLRLFLTTDFSGMGTAELACQMVMDSLTSYLRAQAGA